ncbi:endoplasmic reticulum membrane-associated RNA degradation protein isoform X1 [Callorhinchus milii]|uniref:endoplasmic reticulum membrane-associated RNA degradation protein isoform X1 n=1 Tax=Callorhinchus milii TaxID=7868 RepID=UPI001C3FE49C|nr:endoplasmic reticulum membrane-associated RNA degradation protein isoform X1 [Callorhinchus milii]XP_007885201.2 endoplasmic reticulum membrane-associated RNA degradation protein isoform X1 [Callorhinchus milii]
MATVEPINTCLSSEVHYMVCTLGLDKTDRTDLETIVNVSGQICWENITSYVQTLENEEQSLDFVQSVRLLGPVCKTVHLYLLSLTRKQFEDQYGLWLGWTNNKELLIEVFEAPRSSQQTAVALGLMKLTACLERALGDVYLMIGSECPFLLRELMASQELVMVFGQGVMNILRVFLGSPRSLNLRNILWHGFAAPQEIPPMYLSMLLLLTAGLGQLLEQHLLQRTSKLEHRPYFQFTQLEDLAVFPDFNEEALKTAENLIEKSNFIMEIMLPYWREGFTAYTQQRYDDCVILLLPQMEMGLRRIFTTSNNCSNRLLTAESTTLFTTFDEMLVQHLDNQDVNQLPLILGEPLMEILWDLLNHQAGPRIRDHLSHGELDFNVFPREIADHLITLSIVLLYRFSRDEDILVMESQWLTKIISSTSSYRSRFHPIGRLKQQLRDCVKSLQKWDGIPRPRVESAHDKSGFYPDSTERILHGSLTEEIIYNLMNQLLPHYKEAILPVHCLLTHLQPELMTKLLDVQMYSLYCPRIVLEVVALLRKVTSQCLSISEQVMSNTATRYQQWIDKSLRSRQRHNYLRMLNSIDFLHSVLNLFTLLLTVELLNVQRVSEKTSSECHHYLKFLKSMLQYTENMVTCTSPDKNKWDESWDLTKKILLKVKNFYSKS